MILLTADLHLNDLPRDAYRHTWMRDTLPSLLRKHRVELLIILGDLTDSKDNHSAWLTNSIVDHLSALTKICPVIVEMGNHDYIQSDCPFFEFLGKIPELTWIGVPTGSAVIRSAQSLLGRSALFLPHISNYKRDWLSIKGTTVEIDFTSYDLFLTHQTYAGASIGPRKLDGIPPSIFPRDALVISGDIHVPQEFDQIVYAGSPYTITFGETFIPRVLLLDPKTLKLKSVVSPGPQKRLIEFSSVDQFRRLLETAPPTDVHRGDILKIRVTLQPSQAPQWAPIRDEVREWAERNQFNVHLIQPQVDTAKTKSMVKRKTSNRTDEQLLETYAGARAVSEATLTTGMNLLKKA